MSKEQKRFEGTVDEVIEHRHPGSGVLEKTTLESIVSRVPIVAVNQRIADYKLITLAISKKKDLDLDSLDITCVPFAG